MKISARQGFYIVAAVAMLVAIYFMLADSALADLFNDRELLLASVRQLGALGPLLLIGLMVLAIVFNPLPSAPVAIAAGALYGHTLGTVYVVIGAQLGAMIAFLISRTLGYGITGKHPLDARVFGRFSSQNALTVIVFVSRLVPFMSFDLMSYAAGLSALKFWRFALATLLGLMPVSFILAHMGDELVTRDAGDLLWIIVITGLITLVPLLIYGANLYRQSRRR
jgi:uncharacterized membrane protein YdjX (TVP38/TMEM64 family)